MKMSERLRLAWHALTGAQHQYKAAPFSFSVQPGAERWSMAKTGDRATLARYVDEGYSFNALVYAPVAYKARNMAAVPVWAARGTVDNPAYLPDDAPLSELLARPNRFQSRREYQMQRVTYLNLAGNSYTFIDRRNGVPIALYNLRPDRVWIVPDKRGIKGYWYSAPGVSRDEGVPILPDDMIHVKYPNPLDDYEGFGYGLPPLLSAAQSADVDNRATTLLNRLFDSGAMPMGIIKSSLKLYPEDVSRIRATWKERYGGVENWTDVAVLDQDADYRRIGLTFEEMGFETLDERTEARILMVFGVPPILLGTRMGLARSTYSNYEEARRQCWEDTLLPELMLFEDADSLALGRDGVRIVYETGALPALRQDVDKQSAAAHRLWTMGVPINQALAAVGLHLDVPGGDAPPPDAPKAAAPMPPAAVPTTKNDAPTDRKARLWKSLDDIAVSHEGAFRTMAAEQFELDRREVLALVTDAKKKALERKATIDWQAVADDALKIFEAAGERWREAFVPQVRGVVEDVAGFWNAEAGIAFDVARLKDQAFFLLYSMDFWNAISMTSRETIGGVIQRGLRDGWSIEQMQQGLDAVFQQWISGTGDADLQRFAAERLQPHRTELIARTETTKATAWGTWRVGVEAGVKAKEWLHTQDDRTRDSHLSMAQGGVGGQVRAIDAPFDLANNVRMQHPGDSSLGAPLSEIGNCRCAMALIVEDE